MQRLRCAATTALDLFYWSWLVHYSKEQSSSRLPRAQANWEQGVMALELHEARVVFASNAVLELHEARVVFASNAVYWQKTVRTVCGVPVHFLLVPLDPVLLYVHRNHKAY